MHIEKPLFPLNTKFFQTVFFEMKMFYGYVIFNYTVLYFGMAEDGNNVISLYG